MFRKLRYTICTLKKKKYCIIRAKMMQYPDNYISLMCKHKNRHFYEYVTKM